MYSIAQFGEMMADKVRMDAYAQALRDCVKPDSVVLDIGTGTGIFALLACKLGARRVFAVEPSDAIQVARDLAVANGCAERIEFFQALSTRVTLPERADVIVSDLRGVLPLHGEHLDAIADARRRHLAPGGVLLPRSDSLWAALVQSEREYRRVNVPWAEGVHGIEMRPVSSLVANQWWRADVVPKDLLSTPACWAQIDYASVDNADAEGEITLVAAQAGTTHGICMWFDAQLSDTVRYSNAAGAGELVYGRAFFPWLRPMRLEAGDQVRLRLQARFTGGDYLWTWNSTFHDSAGAVKGNFRQSTFLGMPLVPGRLGRQSASHVPQLGEDGKIDMRVLEMMSQRVALGEIADLLASQFPSRFADGRAALVHVAALSVRYGRDS
ncbi:MAG: 50S ribosomal protein L11 methyltransferase [Pseudomonadota bacterium]